MARWIPGQEREMPLYGMNTLDSPKILAQHVSQELINIFPGPSAKPRNGVNDAMLSTSLLGYGSNDSLLRPHCIHIEAGGNTFFFIWHRSEADKTEYAVEVWNLTAGTRTTLELGQFAQEEVYMQMIKLHGGIYCVIEHEFSTNHSSQYRTKNKILEYIDGAWAVREMGIDVAPTATAYITETEGVAVLQEVSEHVSIVFDNKLCVIGGYDGAAAIDKVYSSTDRISWTEHTVSAISYVYDESGNQVVDESGQKVYIERTWKKRAGAQAVLFDGKLWLFGGYDETGAPLNDVWYTEDLDTWVLHKEAADWGARKYFAAAVHNAKVFLLGGDDGSADAEVWYSTDMSTWTQQTVTVPFTARYGHTTLSYDSKLWVLLGDSSTDVLYSTDDGATWTAVTADAGLGARKFHSSLEYEGSMWIIAGDVATTKKQDVYKSTDGVTWTTVSGTADFTARSGQSVVEFSSELVLVAGFDGTNYLNDIWTSADGVTWTLSTGGLTAEKYYSYALTFTRRNDEDAVLQSLADYNYEAWEVYNGDTVTGPDEILLPGTVSLSGTALTGSGTDFTDLTVGDALRIDGTAKYYTITEITDTTNAVVANPDGDSYTAKEFALIPAAGSPITTLAYHEGIAEGVEDEAGLNRFVLRNWSTQDRARTFLELSYAAARYVQAIAKGATHLRVYRTLGGDTATEVQGLSHRFVADVAIKYTDPPAGAFTYKVYRDNLTDATLTGQTHTIQVTGLNVAPSSRFCTWAAGALWVGGDPDNPGYWFRSQKPSDTRFPEKYASLFDLDNDYATCDPDDGQKDSGVAFFQGDLYFFKERKIFVLAGADLDNFDPDDVSRVIGCVCPQTITEAQIELLGGPCLLWISESGPAVMTSGGKVRLLVEHKVGELWPSMTGILKKSDGTPTDWYTRNKVTASFADNTWWIFYGDSEDADCELSTNKCFGFHFGKDGVSIGPMQHSVADHATKGVIYEPQILISLGNKSYTFSHKKIDSTRTYRLTRFLDPTKWVDTFLGAAGNIAIQETWTPRPFYANVLRHNRGIAEIWLLQIDFEDTDGLVVTLRADGSRHTAALTFSQIRKSGVSSTGANAYRDFVGGRLFEGFKGHYFDMKIVKTVPATGAVEIFGPQFYVTDTDDDLEFLTNGVEFTSTLTFVKDANATPEENAHA